MYIMNVSMEDKNSVLKPVLDIIIYATNERMYAEYCKIIDNKETAYKPLSYKAFNDLKNSIDLTKALKPFVGIIPENVLYYEQSEFTPSITWFCKSKRRVIHGFGKNKFFKYPNLVFSLKANQLFVFISKDNKITNETTLYHCPFPNIYTDGHLCFGTMRAVDFISQDYAETIKGMENAFFNSKWTMNLMGGIYSSSELKLMKECINKNEPMPETILIKHKKIIDVIH